MQNTTRYRINYDINNKVYLTLIDERGNNVASLTLAPEVARQLSHQLILYLKYIDKV